MRRTLRLFLLGAPLAGGAVLALLLAAMWWEHRTPLELPRPTGPFGVGRIAAVWTDSARADPLAPPPARARELLVWIWYPAATGSGATRAPYMPRPLADALAAHTGWFFSTFLARDPGQVRAHAVADAPLTAGPARFPAVIFRSGIGAFATDYTTISEDLASHGYVVVSADAPYSTTLVVMPDGRVIARTVEGNPGDAPMPEERRIRIATALVAVWTADDAFLADRLASLDAHDPAGRFTGRLDLAALGVAGHSFGGATAAQFCHDDRRCRAGIDIDGRLFGSVIHEGMTQPFLFFLSDHGGEWAAPDCDICRELRSAATAQPGDRPIVALRGAHHFSFSDDALTRSQVAYAIVRTLGVIGSLDARDGLAATTRSVREFFDVHLRSASRAVPTAE